MDVERADPTEHYATKFQIRPLSSSDYTKKARLPIKSLSLRETEELMIRKSKLRPTVILGGDFTFYDDIAAILKGLGRMHLQETNCLFVLPLYGVEEEKHEGGFPTVMAARIKALLYRQFFYFPRKGSPLALDSVGRLDRIQPLIYHYQVCRLEPYALSDETLSVLLAMVRELFVSEKEELLDTVKEIVYEALPEEARPQ
jgi:hypothetical protein